MEQRLTRLWYGSPAGPSWLQPLGWLYGGVMRLRRRSYQHGLLRRHRIPRPVVVVGNLTVGGTGKTPLVIWLAQRLHERGLKVGVVSRGYGRAETNAQFVRSDSVWQQVGDEPLLVHNRTDCQMVVARDRVEGARMLVSQGVDVVLADDGLQHLRLARNCEIVVVDGARGFGNGRVLPAGPLREDITRLKRCDAIVINGAPEHPSLSNLASLGDERVLRMTLTPEAARRLDGQGPSRALEDFRGQPIHAVAGIGNPTRFFRELRGHGLDIIEHPFPDHHPFSLEDVAFADEWPVLMTEKDAVKCGSFASPRLWFLPVTARFSEAHAHVLLERVVHRLAAFSGPGG